MNDASVNVPMEPPKLGKARKSRDCDITAELDSCKKMMAYLASEDGDGHDVQLTLKDGTEIPAHSFILRLRSEKLRSKVDAAKAKGRLLAFAMYTPPYRLNSSHRHYIHSLLRQKAP